MRHLKTLTVMLLCLASTAGAQGRRGRLGGPMNGMMPAGPLCYDRGSGSVRDLLGPCPVGFAGADPLSTYFFTPDLIVAHKEAIGLTEAQEASVRTLMLDAQKSFVPVQLKVAAEVEKLQKLIKVSPVDEKAVLDEVDRVLTLEREIKHAQLTLMVRLKNLLTPQQQDALAKLRSRD